MTTIYTLHLCVAIGLIFGIASYIALVCNDSAKAPQRRRQLGTRSAWITFYSCALACAACTAGVLFISKLLEPHLMLVTLPISAIIITALAKLGDGARWIKETTAAGWMSIALGLLFTEGILSSTILVMSHTNFATLSTL